MNKERDLAIKAELENGCLVSKRAVFEICGKLIEFDCLVDEKGQICEFLGQEAGIRGLDFFTDEIYRELLNVLAEEMVNRCQDVPRVIPASYSAVSNEFDSMRLVDFYGVEETSPYDNPAISVDIEANGGQLPGGMIWFNLEAMNAALRAGEMRARFDEEGKIVFDFFAKYYGHGDREIYRG